MNKEELKGYASSGIKRHDKSLNDRNKINYFLLASFIFCGGFTTGLVFGMMVF